MQLNHSDAHTVEFVDQAAMSFMALVVHYLNGALQEQNIQDAQQRQEICSSFLFEFAYRLDAGWFVEGNSKLFPKVCFAERSEPAAEENLGPIQALHIPTEASSWHEYAHGVVSQYFEDEHEAKPSVRTGSYDIED